MGKRATIVVLCASAAVVFAGCVEPGQRGQIVVNPGAGERLETVCRVRGQRADCVRAEPWDDDSTSPPTRR